MQKNHGISHGVFFLGHTNTELSLADLPNLKPTLLARLPLQVDFSHSKANTKRQNTSQHVPRRTQG
jgi:hypothetical protein